MLVDRFDRKRLMMVSDVSRGAMYAAMPFMARLWAIYLLSFLIECFSLVWAPAKDASMPNMVPKRQLGTRTRSAWRSRTGRCRWGGSSYTALAALCGDSALGSRTSSDNSGSSPLWLDGATFFFSAYMVSRLTLQRLSGRRERARRAIQARQASRDLREGLRFMREPHAGPGHADRDRDGVHRRRLGHGDGADLRREHARVGATGWGLLVTALGVGMGLGMAGWGSS